MVQKYPQMPTVITKVRAVCLDSHSESLTRKARQEVGMLELLLEG